MDEDADTGGAERAFEALRAEVAALRQAVEGQAAPDYALTLGVIAKELQDVGARLTAMEASPQLKATPAAVAQLVHPLRWRYRLSRCPVPTALRR